jgi:hypothetical protein
VVEERGRGGRGCGAAAVDEAGTARGRRRRRRAGWSRLVQSSARTPATADPRGTEVSRKENA